MKKFLLALPVIVFMLNACAPAVTDVPIAASTETATPQMSKPTSTATVADPNLVRGNVYLDSTELITEGSSPVQFTLVLKGSLPTPCNQLRVDASQPDAENKVNVDVYSVTRVDKICAQVTQPFEENFLLGSFPAGHYTLWVNGEKIAEFEA